MLVKQVLKYLNWPSKNFSGKDELQECTKGIRMQKYLREKLLPPHSMHCNNFSSYIYVEKTPEQCNLNHYSSQRARENAWWDIYLREGLNGWQVCDQDGLKGDYIMKKTPYRRGVKEKLRGKREKELL